MKKRYSAEFRSGNLRRAFEVEAVDTATARIAAKVLMKADMTLPDWFRPNAMIYRLIYLGPAVEEVEFETA